MNLGVDGINGIYSNPWSFRGRFMPGATSKGYIVHSFVGRSFKNAVCTFIWKYLWFKPFLPLILKANLV